MVVTMLFPIFLLLTCSLASGARILAIFNFPSYSHHVVYAPLYRELASRGHEMVVVTTNPLNDPTLTNLTEIDISYLYSPVAFVTNVRTSNYLHFVRSMAQYSLYLFDELMKNKEVRKLVNDTNQHFDLVIVEEAQPLLYSFGKRFNAPIVGIMSLDTALSTHSNLGNPVHPLLYTDAANDYSEPLSMWKKVQYTVNTAIFKTALYFVGIPMFNTIVRKHMGQHMPCISEYGKPSMLFISINPFFHPNRPLTPQTITIPFIHVRQPKPLPEDLEEILNNSTQGVVYLSLGSNVKSSTLPVHLQKTIINAISDLPYTVLWKWEADHVPELGKNVVTRKWFPQQDILAHPNVKVFVSQGGLQSSEEALLRGKPMVGLPFIVEQHRNVKISQKLGIAIAVEPMSMTKDSLKTAIIEVAENNKYSQKVQQLRNIAEDQPMTSLEKAVFWTEYVIRHNGTQHLKSAAADMPLYEYLLLDVIAVMFISLLIGSVLSYYIIKRVYQKLLGLYLRNVNKMKIS